MMRKRTWQAISCTLRKHTTHWKETAAAVTTARLHVLGSFLITQTLSQSASLNVTYFKRRAFDSREQVPSHPRGSHDRHRLVPSPPPLPLAERCGMREARERAGGHDVGIQKQFMHTQTSPDSPDRDSGSSFDAGTQLHEGLALFSARSFNVQSVNRSCVRRPMWAVSMKKGIPSKKDRIICRCSL